MVAPSYAAEQATQHQEPVLPDIVPSEPAARRLWAHTLAFDATLYGTASVLQYQQMHAQAVDRQTSGYTGFNVFAHERVLAGPGYKPFKTPNADTLYSNAWLDLTKGPVLLEVPDTAGRYYTANFLDMYANATNISARTHGMKGGRYLIAPVSWQGTVPPGVELFRVATPYTWILLRILVSDPADVRKAAALQDQFKLTPTSQAAAGASPAFPPAKIETAADFFRILDFVLRTNGHPVREEALVCRYRGIGIAGDKPFDAVAADASIRAGLEDGYADARQVIASSIKQRTGRPTGQWGFARDVGRYGFNYLLRANINTLGTGANVRDENATFVTFADEQGEPLDGSTGSYRLVLEPPPALYFWSLTLYDAQTQELHPNPIKRYLINDRTKGLRRDANGSATLTIQAERPSRVAVANWLPAPKGRFYLVIRAQGPTPELVEGQWKPRPVERVTPESARRSAVIDVSKRAGDQR